MLCGFLLNYIISHQVNGSTMVYIVNCNISAMHFKMDMTIYAYVNSLFLLPSTVYILISAINDGFFFFFLNDGCASFYFFLFFIYLNIYTRFMFYYFS